MRYSPQHKADVRQKIVQDAALRVRGEGLNGTAVTAVMHDTGLTHGGFYKHFASKDDLLVESVREAFRDFSQKLVEVAEQSRSKEPWKSTNGWHLTATCCSHPMVTKSIGRWSN